MYKYVSSRCKLKFYVPLLTFFCTRCLIPKVFINHSCFLVATMLSIITPTISPNPYPIKTIFQPSSKKYSVESLFFSKTVGKGGEESEFQHFFDNGFPHKPKFPSNELFSNVSNCFPYGIKPVRLF